MAADSYLFCLKSDHVRKLYLHVSLLGYTLEYISDPYARSIYTARFIVWQPRRAADTSTNWRQSLFCCCTASMEQATDRAETAAIDELISLWSENISVSLCLRATGYGLTLWCALGLLVGAAIQVPQLQLQLHDAKLHVNHTLPNLWINNIRLRAQLKWDLPRLSRISWAAWQVVLAGRSWRWWQ